MSVTRELYESYLEIQGVLEPKVIQEEVDLMEDINLLDDEELEDIVDETIFAMAEEGYTLDDIESAFDDIISEATVTVGTGSRRASGQMSSSGRTVTIGRGTELRNMARKAQVVKNARDRQVQAVKNAPGDAVNRVKNAVKSGVGKVRRVVDNAAADYAAKNKLVASKAGKPLNRTSIGMKQASKDPSARREIRSKVVGHLASRAKAKIQSGINAVRGAASNAASSARIAGRNAASSARVAGRKVGYAAKDAGDSAVSSVKKASDTIQSRVASAKDSTKSRVKSGLGRLARGIASRASSVASRFGEDVDIYDVVFDHILSEGYADTEESAIAIMSNMSEDWIDSIVEEYADLLDERNRGERGMSDWQVRRRRDKRDGYPSHLSGGGVRVGGMKRFEHDSIRGRKKLRGKVLPHMRGPNDNVSNYYQGTAK